MLTHGRLHLSAPGRWLSMRLAPPAAAMLIRAVRATMRLRHVDRETIDGYRREGRAYIQAFWHGHLLMMTYGCARQKMVAMISEHRDGELIARTMSHFGHRAVRGSTTSGGAAALRAAVRALREGNDVAFTPDGPKGPRHTVQMGVIQASRLSGAPIVPVIFAASRAKVFGSWDAFVLPYPFSRGVFVYGEPVTVPTDCGEDAMESARLTLEQRMRDLSKRAETLAADPVALARAVEHGRV